MNSGLVDILGSFSVNQLRDLAFAMSSRGVVLPKHNAGKELLLEALKAKATDAALEVFAHRVEAVTPYKHLFVYSLDADLNFEATKARIEEVFPGLAHNVRPITPQLGELEAQACVTDEVRNRVYLKLVHQVEMSGWVSVSRTEKRLQEFRRRHPVVITFRHAEALLTIGFPGFTYTDGIQHENRTVYSDIAVAGAEFLKTRLNINCNPFNAKPSIEALLEEEPDEVTDIKRNVRPKKGGRFGFDAGEEGKVTTALTDFLTREGNITVSEAQIQSLLRRAGASDIVLFWKRLGILTRVALLQDGPELLFVWRESGPLSTAVDSVLQKLTSYERIVGRPTVNSVRRSVLATKFDEVVQPAAIAQEHSISRSDALEILNLAVAKGKFEPRFRVNTDSLLLDFSNTWRRNLAEFPKTVTDENGLVIDLSSPSNIEVGFERVK